MRLFIAAALLTSLLLASVSVAEEPSPAEQYMSKAREKYIDWTQRGLRSFTARVFLRTVGDPNLDQHKEMFTFDYSWTSPDKDEYNFKPEVPEKSTNGIKQALGKLYGDLTGMLAFATLDSGRDLALEESEKECILKCRSDLYGDVKVSFDPESLKILWLAAPKFELRIEYELTEDEGLYRIARRTAWLKGEQALKTRYYGYRKVGLYVLPTRIEAIAKGKPWRFAVEYSSINGRPARMEPLDPKEVKAEIAEMEKGWAQLSDEEKVDRIDGIAEFDHDLSSAAIARIGLMDPSPAVREGAAKALGRMKRKNVTPALIASMRTNEKFITAYLAILWALGELNDPRAVKVLSTDWWNQRVPEHAVAAARAKIQALGKIRHVSSVDALLDILYVTRDETLAEFKKDLLSSLVKLTGQNFGYDRKQWKDWWRNNRARHRFD